jgi:molybdopterin synthase sulfur carrier subunit
MNLRLLFFAQSSDWVHQRQLDLDFPSPKRIVDLLNEVPALNPILEKMKSLRVAVNHEFSDFDCEVKNGDEVAFIPPISGG